MINQDIQTLVNQLDNILLGKPEKNKIENVNACLALLEEKLINLSQKMEETKDFSMQLAEGHLDIKMLSRDNYICFGLKEIQASLLHLTWQVKQIEKGDYGQQVDFLGEFSLTFNRMIKRLKERETELETDKLTGARNLVKFRIDAVKKIKNKKSKYALVLINIDKFKIINDTFGFKKGDEVICIMSESIKKVLDPKEIFGRYVADQFYILLNYENHRKTLERIKTIYAIIEDEFKEKISQYYTLILLSGVYVISEKENDDVEFDIYTNKARYALKDIKGKTENSILYYNEKIKQKLLESIEFETKMKAALKNGEFEMYLQPKYSLNEERVVGAEALVRWNEPEKGLISPDAFIKIFENNGFMVKIDFYMLEQACLTIRKWLDAGITPINISVNFSRLHLNNQRFVNELVEVLNKYEIPPKYIEIELTERIFFDNTKLLIEVMNELHHYGFKLSMDDFGSGYSSLGLLKDLPLDIIKLDRTFFTDYTDLERGHAVIKGVIDIAKTLNIQTVAEGVETEEHIKMLKEFGCDIVQGFYYGKPVTVEIFNRLMM
ncbi:MAG: EAL domain-containing protein [Eubacterium sp.]